MDITSLKKLLREHSIYANKKLDQHFLIDAEVLNREVEYANITEQDTVLEIGPGPGTLTELLAKKAKKVIVIEKDEQFRPILEEIPNVEVIIADALKVDFPKCNKIVSNLPYGISSSITFKILEQPIELAVLCYQKEFATRMSARAGTRNYSRLSVNTYLRADVELLEDVPKEKYFPVPEVNSTIVKLTPKQIKLPEKFDDICRALFQHKNKKVKNALLDSHHELGTEKEVKKFIKKLGLFASKKVTELSPEEILKLSKKWSK
jgi:16S rRNA (adenine1518-N6/adenine1519-N6)-dimethyltransferase